MKDFLIQFASAFSNRRSQYKKRHFLKCTYNRYQKSGIPLEIKRFKKRSGNASMNLLIGDWKKADTILLVGYDTPERSLLPNYPYYPFDLTENKKMAQANFVLKIILSIVIIGVWGFSFSFLDTNSVNRILVFVFYLFLLFLLVIIMKGWNAKYNFNKNSAAIVLCDFLARDIVSTGQFALFLLDNTADGYDGYQDAAAILDNQISSKKLIILDCIASGESLFAAHGHTMKTDVSFLTDHMNGQITPLLFSEEEINNSILSIFPRSVMIAGGVMTEGKVLVEHTKNAPNLTINEERLESLKEALKAYLLQKK